MSPLAVVSFGRLNRYSASFIIQNLGYALGSMSNSVNESFDRRNRLWPSKSMFLLFFTPIRGGIYQRTQRPLPYSSKRISQFSFLNISTSQFRSSQHRRLHGKRTHKALDRNVGHILIGGGEIPKACAYRGTFLQVHLRLYKTQLSMFACVSLHQGGRLRLTRFPESEVPSIQDIIRPS